ncbi:uncharacterized protein Dana_GF27580 [Drosophila ananassae]|uniref:Uncharacterized protein n=1 Tax=Drosophila ananassae TaxID=7217 RepID=A0A0P8YHH0_DROAN|nr:uncharacterized protein Dana_GF27580 [Drosophila ananassae]
MRSHVAVYRAPETAPPAPPYGPLRYPTHQQQQQQQLGHWPGSPAHPPPPPPPSAAGYNLQRLHHAAPHPPSWTTSPATGPPPQPSGYGVVNQQRINECAGIPLISNASSHLSPGQRQRLLRKSTPKSTPSWPPGGASMSQLAVHAQGMPLLQQKFQPPAHPHSHHPMPPTWSAYHPMSHQGFKLTDKSRTLRYQNSAPPVLTTQEKPGVTASGQDQSTSQSETCLPRIIKPRKRRKKDRKPGNGVLLKLEPEMQPKMTSQGDGYPGGVAYHLPPGMLQHDHTHGVCFCRDCDPLRSLWDYPLRRSLSDASSSEQGGGSRESSSSTSSTHSDSSCDSSISSQSRPNPTAKAVPPLEETAGEEFAPITGDSSRADIVGVIGSQRSHPSVVTMPSQCLSDDSGYGDILSGINIVNDLFGNCFRGGGGGNTSSSSSSSSAETLLDESLNEISRKLIETCNGPDNTAGSASDSGLDSAGSHNCNDSSAGLVFNFEHLNLNLTDATPTALNFLVDCNNNNNNNNNSNCMGLVWCDGGVPKELLVEGGGGQGEAALMQILWLKKKKKL